MACRGLADDSRIIDKSEPMLLESSNGVGDPDVAIGEVLDGVMMTDGEEGDVVGIEGYVGPTYFSATLVLHVVRDWVDGDAGCVGLPPAAGRLRTSEIARRFSDAGPFRVSCCISCSDSRS